MAPPPPETTSAPWPYKKTLLTGASSGIGAALTARIIASSADAHVIAVARRADKLRELQAAHGGPARITVVEFDIGQVSKIAGFVHDTIQQHPDLDSVVLNAGMQRGFDFAKPNSVDLELFSTEITTNYVSAVHSITHFLPHFQSIARSKPAAMIVTTSNLAVVPMSRCPGYCATKAALHSFLIALRLQLNGDVNVPAHDHKSVGLRVIEIMPPAVQTELHDARHQPDLAGIGNFGMPLDEFTEEAFARIVAGEEFQISVGSPPGFDAMEDWRLSTAERLASRGNMPK